MCLSYNRLYDILSSSSFVVFFHYKEIILDCTMVNSGKPEFSMVQHGNFLLSGIVSSNYYIGARVLIVYRLPPEQFENTTKGYEKLQEAFPDGVVKYLKPAPNRKTW